MNPRDITVRDLAYWADLDPRVTVFTAPSDPPDCTPCPGLVTGSPFGDGVPVCRVALTVDEIELAHLARGGTLWLSCWGGLPVFMVEVQEP